jgi:hypothetical protein
MTHSVVLRPTITALRKVRFAEGALWNIGRYIYFTLILASLITLAGATIDAGRLSFGAARLTLTLEVLAVASVAPWGSAGRLLSPQAPRFWRRD